MKQLFSCNWLKTEQLEMFLYLIELEIIALCRPTGTQIGRVFENLDESL